MPVDGRRADVAVVGAGITGLLTALLLQRAGADVLVLDRHGVGGVATRNTTAKVSALQGLAYRRIAATRGHEHAAMYGTAQMDAVAALRRLISELRIECGLTEASAFTYATEVRAAELAEEELAAATNAGVPVECVSDTELPFPVRRAIRLEGQAHLNPGSLCAGLAAALGQGCLVEHAAVVDVREESDGCAVVLDGGARITSDHVVLATQAPISDPALLSNRCTPWQSYCLAARFSDGVPQGMYLSCDESTRSLRPALVNGEVVAVIAGAGHRVGAPQATHERWEELRLWAAQSFGEIEVTHRWATHDLESTDRVPFIGRLSASSQRRWVATGFAKWGMTNAYVAAHVISSGIAGSDVPWASAFDSTRVGSTLNRDLIPIAATAAQGLVGDRILRRQEPRCSHQGCVLRSDPALGTWDCPCHGSRFAADGTVIQGPASRPVDTAGP